MGKTLYTTNWYERRQSSSLESARKIVPILMEYGDFRSIVDIGCGTGDWLSVFCDLGVESVLGVDGPWVDKSLLKIPPDAFLEHDLSGRVRLKRQFDAAICLEVAEHINAAALESFLKDLTKLAPVIFFSAAVPGQGGVGHVNEQWPEYWARLFMEEGFLPVDCVRPRIWNLDVSYWYSQNLIVYVKKKRLNDYPLMKAAYDSILPIPLALVHPSLFLAKCDLDKRSSRELSKAYMRAARRSLKKRFTFSR